MANKNYNPYPGVDWTKSASWPTVTDPVDGLQYRQAPGYPGVVFDPTSNRAGPESRVMPSKKLESEKRAQEQLNPKPSSTDQITGQLAPIIGGVAGTAGGVYAAGQIAGVGSAATAPAGAGIISGGAAAAPTSIAASAPVSAVLPTTTVGAGSGAGIIGTGSAASSAGAPSAATGVASGGIGILPLAGIAAGTYLGGKSALNLLQGKEDNSVQGMAGRGILGVATGGLSEVARPFLMHESTRDVARKNTAGLLSVGQDDKQYQDYVKGMREQYNSAPKDPSKPFAGQYSSWDEYKKAGLQAGDLTGVYGNLKTFGPEWSKLSQDQRVAVTQGLINADLYDSKKGEVVLKDEAKAKGIFDSVVKPAQKTEAQPSTQSKPQPVGRVNTVTNTSEKKNVKR